MKCFFISCCLLEVVKNPQSLDNSQNLQKNLNAGFEPGPTRLKPSNKNESQSSVNDKVAVTRHFMYFDTQLFHKKKTHKYELFIQIILEKSL